MSITVLDTQRPSINASLAMGVLWPPNHAGGDQSPDATSIASGTLRLRAERNANGNGRVYLICITAADAFANTSRTCIAAVVPKSQSAAGISSVNAAAQAATSACNATGNPPAGYFVVGDGPLIGPKQ